MSKNPNDMVPIRNVIFDWSGTLVNDLPAVWRATNYTLTRAGRSEMTLEEFRAEFSLPFDEFYDRVTPGIPLEKLEEWYKESFAGEQKKIEALPHAYEFFDFCCQKGLRTFLLSTIHPDHYQAQSERIHFEFEREYVRVMDKRAKIHDILAENKLEPETTVFIGDMQHDIETAHAGGIRSCSVLTGFNTLAQLRLSKPDLVVEHLGELQELLGANSMHLPNGAATARRPVATVGALIYDETDQVLMVRTRKWSDKWGIPGGKIEFGETAEAALERELEEETGLSVTDIKLELVQDCIGSDEFYRDEHFLLINYTCRCVGDAKVRLNEEAQAFEWVEPRAALKLNLNRPTKVLLEAVL
jgi:phosphoglycolate phosphatase-like HAD superfamily hydrolase/ADP-ribose pyrophosphatase YjhB (NUDIX family)